MKPITKFTIPGGHRVVSLCHVCRTVCRRAERAALRADAKYGIAPEVLMYLNRLSDYFYLLGRTLTEYFSVEETCGFRDGIFIGFFPEFRTICRGVFFRVP